MPTDETHDPSLRSWVESANDPGTDFPIQNLPIVAFRSPEGERGRVCSLGVAVGDRVVDLHAVRGLVEGVLARGGWSGAGARAFADDALFERIAGAPRAARSALRRWLSAELSAGRGSGELRAASEADPRVLRHQRDVIFAREPALARNYTDFYASIHHATTVGSMFRPDNPLLPNYKHVPIGYHGRASSIVPSGTGVRRPRGQIPPPDSDPGAGPTFAPTQMLDYELEVGCVVGAGNALGEPIPIERAEEHVLGLCLVNDWSARDIQKWEYQPLGPFLAKNFATTVSPFIVTLDALEPFRCPAEERRPGDPRPLPYLLSERDRTRGGYDITLEVHLRSAEMERRGMPPVRLSRAAFRGMYWTFAQMLAHHASNGCNLLPGDLLASGTVSGPEPEARGCLLELTWQGRGADGKPLPRRPIELPTGEKRLFLADGDEVIFRAWCERDGFRRIGFGECRGRVLPAL